MEGATCHGRAVPHERAQWRSMKAGLASHSCSCTHDGHHERYATLSDFPLPPPPPPSTARPTSLGTLAAPCTHFDPPLSPSRAEMLLGGGQTGGCGSCGTLGGGPGDGLASIAGPLSGAGGMSGVGPAGAEASGAAT